MVAACNASFAGSLFFQPSSSSLGTFGLGRHEGAETYRGLFCGNDAINNFDVNGNSWLSKLWDHTILKIGQQAAINWDHQGRSVVETIAAIAAGVLTGGEALVAFGQFGTLGSALGAMFGVGGASLSFGQAVFAGAVGGFASGSLSAAMDGANLGQVLHAGLLGGAIGGAVGGLGQAMFGPSSSGSSVGTSDAVLGSAQGGTNLALSGSGGPIAGGPAFANTAFSGVYSDPAIQLPAFNVTAGAMHLPWNNLTLMQDAVAIRNYNLVYLRSADPSGPRVLNRDLRTERAMRYELDTYRSYLQYKNVDVGFLQFDSYPQAAEFLNQYPGTTNFYLEHGLTDGGFTNEVVVGDAEIPARLITRLPGYLDTRFCGQWGELQQVTTATAEGIDALLGKAQGNPFPVVTPP